VRSDGSANAVPLHIHDLRQSIEHDGESVRCPADRLRRVTDRNANGNLRPGHVRGHGSNRSVDGLASRENRGLAVRELVYCPPRLLSDASACAARGDEDVPQRRAETTCDHGCLGRRGPTGHGVSSGSNTQTNTEADRARVHDGGGDGCLARRELRRGGRPGHAGIEVDRKHLRRSLRGGTRVGAEEVARTRQRLGWSHPPFVMPDVMYQAWDARPRGQTAEQAWQEKFTAYRTLYPGLADELLRRTQAKLPQGWSDSCQKILRATADKAENMATRKASQQALEKFGPLLPELIGGSADLAGSNLTIWSGSKDIRDQNHSGNYIYYGVREFAMAAINNGIALHGGFIPYSATFLIFSDYARNALRMAALMGQRSIFILTHDSIGLGEDGPTHQAVEQAASLRMIPNMSVWRPCDAVETAIAWKAAIERRQGPTCLLLSRQNLKPAARSARQIARYDSAGCAATMMSVRGV